MANLGTFLLLSSFVVCAYAAVSSVVGARRGSRRLIESGVGALYLVAALMAVATAVIINAFLTDDLRSATSRRNPRRCSRCSTRSPRSGAG
jgi:cytochrome c biogenesis factor